MYYLLLNIWRNTKYFYNGNVLLNIMVNNKHDINVGFYWTFRRFMKTMNVLENNIYTSAIWVIESHSEQFKRLKMVQPGLFMGWRIITVCGCVWSRLCWLLGDGFETSGLITSSTPAAHCHIDSSSRGLATGRPIQHSLPPVSSIASSELKILCSCCFPNSFMGEKNCRVW